MRPEEAVVWLRSQGYQAEVIYADVMTVEYSWEKKSQYGMTYREEGYGLRVIKDGRQGFAYGHSLDDELMRRAMESAAAVSPDPYVGLPGPEPVEPLAMSYDPATEEPHEQLRGFLEELKASMPSSVNLVSARSSAGRAKVRLVNSEGVDVESINSFAYLAASANAVKGNYVGPEVYEYTDSKLMSGISVSSLVKGLTYRVEMTSSRREASVANRPIALTPKAVSQLLFPLLNHAVRADSVHRGRSPLRLNEFVGQKVTVIDDPRVEGAAWSRAFDGEGLPTRRVTVIDNGMFVRPLSDTYWSRRAGFESTHSAWRTFTGLPTVSATYLVIQAQPEADLGDAVVVDEVQGVHTSNFDTGEFAVNVSVAWDKDGGLREFVLSGSLKGLLSGIQGSAGPATRYGRVISGTLLVMGLRAS